jgi:hypothetical protein
VPPSELGVGLNLKSISWGKLAIEVVVLAASVYLAIFFEGASDDRARRAAALEALRSLRTELQRDLDDVAVILEAQADRDVRHQRLERWLSSVPVAHPDSFATDLRALTVQNRTLFPRRATWTTMLSSAQLADLGDPGLVDQLANLYENVNQRVEYNGVIYDESLTDVARNSFAHAWDPVERRLLLPPGTEVAEFRSQLAFLHEQNLAFIGLLEAWRGEVRALMDAVDTFLAARPGGT